MEKVTTNSKTIFINLVALAIAYIWGNSFDTTIMTAIADTIPFWLPVANIINRFFTKKPISLY